MAQYEIFTACKLNKLTIVRELLDAGVDVNLEDFDTGATPLYVACSNGSKQTIELLLERGAFINAKTNKGDTPLHALILKRFDALALWLIKQGADTTIANIKGETPKDLAHGFVQKEIEEAIINKSKEQKEEQKRVEKVERKPQQVKEDTIKIYLANGPTGAYKTMKLTSQSLAMEVLKLMAEKINMTPYLIHLELVEARKQLVRKVGKEENVYDLRTKWPLIIGTTGNETYLSYYFFVRLRKEAPEEAQKLYQTAMS